MTRAAAIAIAAAVFGACTNEARIALPDPGTAKSLLIALEGATGSLILTARRLDTGPPPISTFVVDTRTERLTLLYLEGTLEELDIPEGELGPSASDAEGRALPAAEHVFEASFADGSFVGWTSREMPPGSVLAYRLPPGSAPDDCAPATAEAITVDAAGAIAFSVKVDQNAAVMATLDCRLFRVEDTFSDTAPVAERIGLIPGTCTSTSRYTAAARDDDGVVWIGRQDGRVLRFPSGSLGGAEALRTESNAIIVHFAASRGATPRELYAISAEGRLQRLEEGRRWLTLWSEDVFNTYRRLAWIGPGEVLMVDNTACVRRWLESNPRSIEECEPILLESDTLPLVTGVAQIPGVGTLLGAAVFGGPTAGSGVLLRNQTRPGEWDVLAFMPGIGVYVSPTNMAPLDRGFFFVGLTNVIGQFRPPALRACDVRRLGERVNVAHWSDAIPFADGRFLVTGLPVDAATGVEGTAQWVTVPPPR